MALTAREREIIIEMSERQDQLELIIGSLIGGSLGKGAVSVKQELGSRRIGIARSNRDKNLLVGKVAATARSKVKRKVSPYQKRFGVEMKRLIKAHPRTARTRLMSKAHRATKRALK